MLNRYAFVAFLATLLAACAAPVAPDCDGGTAGSGGAPETAYPCGFPGSPKIDECKDLIPDGIAYCGHTGPVDAPFGNCRPMKDPSDAGDSWDWWCCPLGTAGQ